MTERKSMTLRLPEEQAEELAFVAQVDETTVSDEIRAAIAARIEHRRNDPAFQQKMTEVLNRNQELYQRLANT